MTKREIAGKIDRATGLMNGGPHGFLCGLAQDLRAEADSEDAEWRSVVESFRAEADRLLSERDYWEAEAARLERERDDSRSVSDLYAKEVDRLLSERDVTIESRDYWFTAWINLHKKVRELAGKSSS